MARTANNSKHPALMVQRLEAGLEERQNAMMALEGWAELVEDEKIFIAALPYFGSVDGTLKVVKRSWRWFYGRRNRNAQFGMMVERARAGRAEVARELAKDLLGISLKELRVLITEGKNEMAKFKAIEHLHRLTGLLEGPGFAGTMYINAQNVGMFKGAGHDE